MSSSNRIKLEITKAETFEGAAAHSPPTPLMALRRAVLSCFLWEKQFYIDGDDIASVIATLIAKCKAEEVSELAVEARSNFNLRHVPLLMARVCAALKTHKYVVADMIDGIIQRADEITEFMTIYWSTTIEQTDNQDYTVTRHQIKRTPISAQVKKGLKSAFKKFNEYGFAKYNKKGATVSLKDALVMIRPPAYKGTDRYKLYNKIFTDTLDIPMTWEVMLSETGQGIKDEEAKKAAKAAVWRRLIEEDKLGGLAILRNLRNMLQADLVKSEIKAAIEQGNYNRVLPFRFLAAARQAPTLEDTIEPTFLRRLNNLPKLSGKTVLLCDISGSMFGVPVSAKSDMQRVDAGVALAIIAREICEDVDIYSFSTQVMQIKPRRGFALADEIINSQGHYNTYLHRAVAHVNNIGYDRLIVITDEQVSEAVPDPIAGSKAYVINVCSAQNGLSYSKWIKIDGFSEAVIAFISEYESGDYQELL